EVLEIAELLPAQKNTALARIYKGAAFYMAAQEQDLDRALTSLGFARTFDPDDPEIDVTRAYLLLVSKKPGEARTVLDGLRPQHDDAALLKELWGEYFSAVGDFKSAIESFSAAIPMLHDDLYLYHLHLGI